MLFFHKGLVIRTIAMLAMVAGLGLSANAQTTIVDDDFADVDRTKTGALDADWWSSSSTSGNSVEIDANGLGLISGTSGRGIHATFAPQQLAIGDALTVTYAFSTPATIGTNRGGAFKVALMDFNDPGLAADLLSSSSAGNENPLYIGLPGYMADFDVVTTTEDISIRKHDVTSGLGRFLGTTSEWNNLGSSADDGYTFTGNTDYVGVFEVTRTSATTLDIFSSLSQGGTLIDSHLETDDESDGSSVADNFGMFGLWANSNSFGSTNASGDADNGITLTRFTVVNSATAIPEPGSLGLVLLSGMAGLLVRRRNS